MEQDTANTTEQKALRVNLDPQKYGTFAEIGAGQEVARNFFRVGAAAGTIAKTMSAYDMKFSDAIYGKADRYVSKSRLRQMLDHEFELVTERLSESRGKDSTFFVFANTVAARNFKGTNECHGWMGVRFQKCPKCKPNDIIVHVRMLDTENALQADALGIFGVNLIYGAFFLNEDPKAFIDSLKDNLGINRIEVDMINFRGPDFDQIDNRLLSFHLVRTGLTNAVMFAPNGAVLQPSEALYKKNILVERGSFRPVTRVNIDMLECGSAQFMQEPDVAGEPIIPLLELTVNNLVIDGEDPDPEDFLARVDIIGALGYTVLISDYFEYYRLVAYFRRYTKQKIGIVMGINSLMNVFNEAYYEKLGGGILEAFGRFFKQNVRVYAYPMKSSSYNQYIALMNDKADAKMTRLENDIIITTRNYQVPANLSALYDYLTENHHIVPLKGYDEEVMDIFSRNVLEEILNNSEGWESKVPEKVAELIKTQGFFGYKA